MCNYSSILTHHPILNSNGLDVFAGGLVDARLQLTDRRLLLDLSSLGHLQDWTPRTF